MELSDYFRIIRQRGWLILLLALLTALGAYGFSKNQSELYESNLTLLVRPSRTDFGQAQAAKTLLRSLESWMVSSYRAADVIDTLGLDRKPGDLLGDFQVASDDSRFIIQMNVKNSNPEIANDIARTWGNLLIQRQTVINDTLPKSERIYVEFIDDPVAGLASPKTKTNTLAGLVFGGLLGVVIVFLLEWLESGVLRRPNDVEKYLEIPVIGTIQINSTVKGCNRLFNSKILTY